MQSKTSYIIGFASAVCLVCGVIVAGAAVLALAALAVPIYLAVLFVQWLF